MHQGGTWAPSWAAKKPTTHASAPRKYSPLTDDAVSLRLRRVLENGRIDERRKDTAEGRPYRETHFPELSMFLFPRKTEKPGNVTNMFGSLTESGMFGRLRIPLLAKKIWKKIWKY